MFRLKSDFCSVFSCPLLNYLVYKACAWPASSAYAYWHYINPMIRYNPINVQQSLRTYQRAACVRLCVGLQSVAPILGMSQGTAPRDGAGGTCAALEDSHQSSLHFWRVWSGVTFNTLVHTHTITLLLEKLAMQDGQMLNAMRARVVDISGIPLMAHGTHTRKSVTTYFDCARAPPHECE